MSTIQPTNATALDRILAAADSAAATLRRTDRHVRAQYLDAIADALDSAADILVPIAGRETNLPEGRLRGELRRTTFQLRLFAEVVKDGGYLGVRIDHEDPDWPAGGARPDLRRMLIPLGPVLVFSASNFPFAFSVAGGDTASALAAGCPVVVKAHGGHVELSRETARVVSGALEAAGAPAGVFDVIFGTETGRLAVQDPRIKAAGFTGSIAGGRALFDLAQARPEPIPFYGELGSNNPVFVTASADKTRGADIAKEFIGSFTLGGGQFCTKPGTVFVPRESTFVDALRSTVLPDGSAMLNDRILTGYVDSVKALQSYGVTVLSSGNDPFGPAPTPIIHLTTAEEVLANPTALLEECFGPSSLIVEYDDESQFIDIATVLQGQLTASIQAERDEDLRDLVDVLATRAGRVLWNQWPTGVSVTHAQQHGGPYPASTASRSTSVGVAAINRFLRPVAYQGFPEEQLPGVLREGGSTVPSLIDGKPSPAATPAPSLAG